MTPNYHHLPRKPGVYIFKNPRNRVIYVGKAIKLRSRVSSYFQKSSNLPPDKLNLPAQVAKIDYIITDSEREALLLEATLIKKHHPRFNILLTDDKNYQYLQIDTRHQFPPLITTRRPTHQRSYYFGPFTNGLSVHQTLKTLAKIFPYRPCQIKFDLDKPQTLKKRPCLKFHLRACLAPCVGQVKLEEYLKIINQIKLFLNGRYPKLLQELKQKMRRAAAAQQFEKAAKIRDQIRALQKITAAQKVVSPKNINQDFISLASEGTRHAINLFIVRHGKLIHKKNLLLKAPSQTAPAAILNSFIKQYYSQTSNIPHQIITPAPVEDKTALTHWLQTLQPKNRRRRFSFKNPSRGQKAKLLRMGRKNAAEYLEQELAKQTIQSNQVKTTLAELRQQLNLPKNPRRVEAYDISNFGGQEAVGSMVVFLNAKPAKDQYRRFKIKTIPSANDPAMLAEVLTRRFNEDGWPLPDLILIDGGRGQLSAALAVVPKSIPVITLAKRREEIYTPTAIKPYRLPKNSPALRLLCHLRDESHRFAISYHRHIHRRRQQASSLDQIPGLGPTNIKKLQRLLKSNPQPTLAELNAVLSLPLAKRIDQFLKTQK